MTLPTRTTYTCKRGCCAVVTVDHGRGRAYEITLNGKQLTVRELSEELDMTIPGVRRRLENCCCLKKPRQNQMHVIHTQGFNQPLICSESDRLAAQFNRLRWRAFA